MRWACVMVSSGADRGFGIYIYSFSFFFFFISFSKEIKSQPWQERVKSQWRPPQCLEFTHCSNPVCYCPKATQSPMALGRLWQPASLPEPLALMCGAGCPGARLLLLWPGLQSDWVPGGMSCLQHTFPQPEWSACSAGSLPLYQPQVAVPSCSAWLCPPCGVCGSWVCTQLVIRWGAPLLGGGGKRRKTSALSGWLSVCSVFLAGLQGNQPSELNSFLWRHCFDLHLI